MYNRIVRDRIRVAPTASVAALVFACACSDAEDAARPAVALTIDWEGAFVSKDGLAAIDDLREQLGNPPITHFLSSAYFAKRGNARELIAAAIRPGDEVAVHLHAWRTLAEASGVPFRAAPSFLTGTDELMTFEDGDRGFDVDLDAYSVVELRQLLATSRRLLEQAGFAPSRSFRAGGYIVSPKLAQALHDEGFTADSSAIAPASIESRVWADRIAQLWPTLPARLDAAGGSLREYPIAAVADYTTVEELGRILDAAVARNGLVVLAMHQETGEHAERLSDAVGAARVRHPNLAFTPIRGAR